MTSLAPVLVAVAHGTSSAAGRSAIGGLVSAVALRRPDLTVRTAFVDVQPPGPSAVLSSLGDGTPARLAPLLLSAGYHVYVDLAEAAGRVPGTTVAPALGPDDRLADLLRERLLASRLRDDATVVRGAAGSSQASAVADCERVAAALSRRLGRPVVAGYLSAVEPK